MNGLSIFMENTKDYLRVLQEIIESGKSHREDLLHMWCTCGFQEEIKSGSLKNYVDRKLNIR
jgi:hypothetical protein